LLVPSPTKQNFWACCKNCKLKMWLEWVSGWLNSFLLYCVLQSKEEKNWKRFFCTRFYLCYLSSIVPGQIFANCVWIEAHLTDFYCLLWNSFELDILHQWRVFDQIQSWSQSSERKSCRRECFLGQFRWAGSRLEDYFLMLWTK
jgi:hypothetical protein